MKKIKLVVSIVVISLIFVKLSFAPPAQPAAQQPAPTPQAPPANNVPAGMVFVPAGEFMMGCNAAVDKQCEADEKPYHKVYLDAFYIDKFEVTVAQYGVCMQSGKCTKPDGSGSQYGACVQSGKCTDPDYGKYCNWGISGRENHPINCVDWNQANSFCEYAGKRLPTEAQWEKAARGTDGRKYPWGNQEPTCDLAVFNSGGFGCGKNSTWPVGSKPAGASPYGAMDMTGNVWNWVADWYDENYYQSSPNRNPTGPNLGEERVLRGESWFAGGLGSARTSNRYEEVPTDGDFNNGFRCVR